MATELIRERLRDPAYLDLHLAAVAALGHVGRTSFYDANFLQCFEASKRFLGAVRPDALERFVAGFAPLRPLPGTTNHLLHDVFPAATHRRIREIAAEIPRQRLELHEVADFGRHVVHEHEYFTALQQEVQARVEELAGRPLVRGYNFLSLYGGKGVCGLHMDEPMSMYTLDYCIEQSGPWPIHFSNLVDWPDAALLHDWQAEKVLGDPAIQWTPHVLEPNQALLFIGSSQWHYRQPIAPDGFCNLLFFHYYPAGCDDLVRPRRWPAHFDLPELQPLIDLFAETYANFP